MPLRLDRLQQGIKAFWRVSASISLMAATTVCASPLSAHPNDVQRVLASLGTLVYVGQAEYTSYSLGPHAFAATPLPQTIVPNTYYVFHQRRPDQVSWSDLVNKLRENQLEILSAPESDADLTYLPIGGPLYRIEFRAGNMKGKIFTRIDQKILTHDGLSKEWASEDVVLVFQKYVE